MNWNDLFKKIPRSLEKESLLDDLSSFSDSFTQPDTVE